MSDETKPDPEMLEFEGGFLIPRDAYPWLILHLNCGSKVGLGPRTKHDIRCARRRELEEKTQRRIRPSRKRRLNHAADLRARSRLVSTSALP